MTCEIVRLHQSKELALPRNLIPMLNDQKFSRLLSRVLGWVGVVASGSLHLLVLRGEIKEMALYFQGSS